MTWKRIDGISLSAAGALFLFLAVALFSGCSQEQKEAEIPANINPIIPIRNAFIDRLVSLDQPIQGFKAETGHVPEGNSMSVVRDAGISPVPDKDPWGGSVEYSGSGLDYEIKSAGPDKRWGTKDDITVRNGSLQGK